MRDAGEPHAAVHDKETFFFFSLAARISHRGTGSTEETGRRSLPEKWAVDTQQMEMDGARRAEQQTSCS